MATPGRQFNDAVTRFWSLAAPLYDLPFLQRLVYQPAQDEVVAELRVRGIRRVADIACGTGILATRIQNELHPEEVYGVDMSDGMLQQANARSAEVHWRKGPAEHLPFADGSLDAVVTTSAFHFFDQPAAMAEFHRVLATGGLAIVATISPPLPAPSGPGGLTAYRPVATSKEPPTRKSKKPNNIRRLQPIKGNS
jgi:ubiquinone/menaquinone biosynthesis C-methylase UbiE